MLFAEVDWSSPPVRVASTAATVEVDVMPFLARTPEGGPFTSYYESLSNLGAEFVRYAPWFPYPYVVVTELDPPDCNATHPATNWNSTLFDGILSDFMAAVCGEDALTGKCTHSVAAHAATMPVWLYQGAYPVPPGILNPDPWEFYNFDAYNRGNALVNESCSDMAGYMGRFVEHYTKGGHHDSCGHWHGAGFTYNWSIVSILNEDEHGTGGQRYTRCFDAVRKVVDQINPAVTLAGPEEVLYQAEYTHYFLDPANHADKRAPAILSNHFYGGELGPGAAGEGYEAFFRNIDSWFESLVLPLVTARDTLAPGTELLLNEFIPMISDWCDPASAAALFEQHGDTLGPDTGSRRRPRGSKAEVEAAPCPDWKDPKSQPTTANRRTLGWNAAAAAFAYGYVRLGREAGYKAVGADQLIGGPFPDNEPAVSCLDWKSGQPNAKYYAITMLAKALGAGPKAMLNATTSSGPPPAPAPVGTVGNGTCGATAFGGDCNVLASGAWNAAQEGIMSLEACVTKAKNCKMANFVSFSNVPENSDCSWYASCDMSHLCEDCSKCGIGCPHYYPYASEVLHKVPPPPPPPPAVAVLPFVLEEWGRRGVLMVSKTVRPTQVLLSGVGLPGGEAMVLDGTLDGETLEPEPGFVPPVQRTVGMDGVLKLGPYAIAIVWATGRGATGGS